MNCRLIFNANWLSLVFVSLIYSAHVEATTLDVFSTGVAIGSYESFDSLRTERKGGRQVVVHRVDPGETLYSIARRYKVTVEDITKANRGLGTTISVGQEIDIPTMSTSGGGNVALVSSSGESFHQVEVGQTLYAISRLYNVTVDEIKAWNSLTSNELSAGQKLVIRKPGVAAQPALAVSETPAGEENAAPANYPYYIVQPSETLFSISRKFNVSVDEIKDWSKLNSNTLSVGQRILVGKPGSAEVASKPVEETPDREKKKDLLVSTNGSLKQINRKGYTTDTAQVAGYEKVIEEGFALVIENSPDTNKFLALHRTAPIGAILEVKNRMNDRSIYVRVVGTLPDTGVNNKVLIRLSNKAFERLGSLDPRVPVEVSYVP